jgi:large subunit ribosomal protein L32
MGLPGHRRTSSDKRKRAAHFALEQQSVQKCPKCQKPLLPHRACMNCGMYKGRQVLNVGKKIAKKVAAKK